VIELDVADQVLVDRLSGRRVCMKCGAMYHLSMLKGETRCAKCGEELNQRNDDMPETVLNRLKVYHEQTAPLTAYYGQKGLLKRKRLKVLLCRICSLLFLLPLIAAVVVTALRYAPLLNDLSGVLRICFGDASILLTADIGGTIQKMMATEYGPEVLKSDILKAPHHGKNAVNAELLRTVDPKLVLVTGKVDRTKTCVNQIKKAGIPCKLTSYGTILMETDGKDWYVNQEDKWGELEKQRKKLERQQKKKK
jgi:hypothetical protein